MPASAALMAFCTPGSDSSDRRWFSSSVSGVCWRDSCCHRLQTLLHVVAAQQAGSQAALQQGSDLPVLFSGQRFSISGRRPASGSEASCSAALRRACTSLLPSASAACAVSMTERR
jgi:hypothetical protein